MVNWHPPVAPFFGYDGSFANPIEDKESLCEQDSGRRILRDRPRPSPLPHNFAAP